MFKFLKKSTAPSSVPAEYSLYQLAYFADAQMFEEGWIEVSPPPFKHEFTQGKISEEFQLQGLNFRLDGTASGGNIIFSIWHSSRIVTSSVAVDGKDQQTDAGVLTAFVKSMSSTSLVKQFWKEPSPPFPEILATKERPLFSTIVAPLTSVEATRELLEYQRSWVAEFFGG